MPDLETRLREAANVFAADLLRLRKGERLLIYVDDASDPRTAQTVQAAAERIGVRTERFDLGDNAALARRSGELQRKMVTGRFDAVCELSLHYFYYAPAWWFAALLGARLYSIAGLDAAAFVRCVGQVDHQQMYQFGLALRESLKEATHMRLLTEPGTDIQMRLNSGPGLRGLLSRLLPWKAPWIGWPMGLLHRTQRATFLGGQLAFLGIADTLQGTLVIDGHLWPPEEVGTVDAPITLQVQKGSIVEVCGASAQAEVVGKWLHGRDKSVKHLCFGFNPGARLSGHLLEAERVFGGISVGVGHYPFHADGVMKSPTIWLDGRALVEDGTFVDERLAPLAQGLLRSAREKAG